MLRMVISRNTGVKCMPKNAFFKFNELNNTNVCWNLTAMPGPTGEHIIALSLVCGGC